MSIDTDGGTGKRDQRSSVASMSSARVPGGARVPQPEPGDPVGVDVLGRALELGEDRQFVAGALGVRVRHFEQHGAVALHDEGAVSHKGQFYRARGSLRRGVDHATGRTLDDARDRQRALDVGAAVASAQAPAAQAASPRA